MPFQALKSDGQASDESLRVAKSSYNLMVDLVDQEEGPVEEIQPLVSSKYIFNCQFVCPGFMRVKIPLFVYHQFDKRKSFNFYILLFP